MKVRESDSRASAEEPAGAAAQSLCTATNAHRQQRSPNRYCLQLEQHTLRRRQTTALLPAAQLNVGQNSCSHIEYVIQTNSDSCRAR
eukprot:SAG31_NODE_1325_length_8781_cov_5.940221_7_plen_87_part_00